jgi:hypothetical protein
MQGNDKAKIKKSGAYPEKPTEFQSIPDKKGAGWI